VLNELGAPVSQEIVDYLPINDARGNVLAGSARRFDTAYAGTAYWYQNEDGTRSIKHRGLGIGLYHATLDLSLNGEEVTEELTFLVFPWFTFFWVVALLAALGYGFRRYRRHAHARLREQIMRELKRKQ
jgi:hypothetical protein